METPQRYQRRTAATADERFNLDAFLALFDRSTEFPSFSAFSRATGISPGTLNDITKIMEETGRPRRVPSLGLVKRLASGLGVPVRALLHDADGSLSLQAESAA